MTAYCEVNLKGAAGRLHTLGLFQVFKLTPREGFRISSTGLSNSRLSLTTLREPILIGKVPYDTLQATLGFFRFTGLIPDGTDPGCSSLANGLPAQRWIIR